MTEQRPKRALDNWLRMQRALIEQEARFAELAESYAAGDVDEADLQESHRVVQAMRELADAVFAEALAHLRTHDRT